MIDRGKHNLLGVQINAIDYEAAVERIIQAAHARQSMGVSALAVHGVMTGVLDAEQGYRLNKLDLVVPDGQPVRWALNMLYGTKLTDRVYGPNLTLYVCERAAAEGLPIYLYGSTEAVLRSFAANLQQRFPALQVAGSQPSRFCKLSVEEKSAVVNKIVEVTVEKEVEKKVVEAVVNTPDFARRQAGARILPEGTSETFVHPDMNFKQFSKSVMKYLGVSSDSSIANSAIVSQISDIADSFVPTVVQILGLDSGIGRPEDAISSDMSLGSCWPMQVRDRAMKSTLNIHWY